MRKPDFLLAYFLPKRYLQVLTAHNSRKMKNKNLPLKVKW